MCGSREKKRRKGMAFGRSYPLSQPSLGCRVQLRSALARCPQDHADGPRERIQFLGTDHEGRHQVHDILEGPDPDTVLDEPRPQGVDVRARGELHDAQGTTDATSTTSGRARQGSSPACKPASIVRTCDARAPVRRGRARHSPPRRPADWPCRSGRASGPHPSRRSGTRRRPPRGQGLLPS